jgi:hypothetical protein
VSLLLSYLLQRERVYRAVAQKRLWYIRLFRGHCVATALHATITYRAHTYTPQKTAIFDYHSCWRDCLLGCDTMWFCSFPAFRRNVLPPFSVPMSKPSRQLVGNKRDDQSACCLFLPWLTLGTLITLLFFGGKKVFWRQEHQVKQHGERIEWDRWPHSLAPPSYCIIHQ